MGSAAAGISGAGGMLVEQLLEAEPAAENGKGIRFFRRNALGWLLEQSFGRKFWIFFTGAFFF